MALPALAPVNPAAPLPPPAGGGAAGAIAAAAPAAPPAPEPLGWFSRLTGSALSYATASTVDFTTQRMEGVAHAAIADLTGRVQGILTTATEDGTARIQGVLNASIAQAVASIGELIATAPTKLVEGTEIAFIKKLANFATTIVEGVRSSLPADRPLSPAITALLEANEQLKAAVANEAITLEALMTASTRVIDRLSESETFIQDVCLGTPKTAPAPDLDALDQSLARGHAEVQVQAAPPPANLNTALSQSLLDLTLRIERKGQLMAVFGDKIPEIVLNNIGAQAPAYREFYNQALTQHLSIRSPLIRPFARFYLNIISFFTGIILDFFCQKLQSSLTKALQDFSNAETSSMMNFFTDIVVDGLKLYSEEIINSARSIRNESNAAGNEPEGTFDARLAAKLSAKTSLRGGCATSQEFYYKVFDLILAKALNGSVVRKIILYVAQKMHFLDDPFMSIPTTIRDTNGYHYALDKAIVAFVNPLLEKMAEIPAEDAHEAPAAGVDAAAEPAAAPKKSKAYSRTTKENLRKALTSLYQATDITRAANVNDLELLLHRQSHKDPSMLSQEYVLVETAEAAALTLLETMNGLLSRDFVMTQMIEAIHVMNNSFVPGGAVTDQQKLDAEIERADALNRLTSGMIGSAIDNAPIINADKTHDKMNALLGQIHTQAERLETLLVKVQNYDPQGPAGKLVKRRDGGAAAGAIPQEAAPETSPYDDYQQIIAAMHRIEDAIREHKEIGSLSESQLSVLKAALDAYKNDLKDLIEGAQLFYINPPSRDLSTRRSVASTRVVTTSFGTRHEADPFHEAVARSLEAVRARLRGDIYAAKPLIGLLSHPKLKSIVKIAVTLLLKDKFNKLYDFTCHPMTVKHLFLNQSLAAVLGKKA